MLLLFFLPKPESAWSEPRRCDYTGLYYCPACHWRSRVVLPARVLHNWDFEERGVSRQAKQFLALMRNKPVLDLEKLNPHLFKFVEELSTVKVREETERNEVKIIVSGSMKSDLMKIIHQCCVWGELGQFVRLE